MPLFDIKEFDLVIPALPRPTLEEIKTGSRDKRPWLRKIEVNRSVTSPVTLSVARIVKASEESIGEGAYLSRLEATTPLGLQHAYWLRDNRDDETKIPAKVRVAIDKIVPKNFIDFPGTIVLRDDGTLGVPTLCQDWDVHFAGLSFVFHRRIALGLPID